MKRRRKRIEKERREKPQNGTRFEKGALLHSIELCAGTDRDKKEREGKREREQEGWRLKTIFLLFLFSLRGQSGTKSPATSTATTTTSSTTTTEGIRSHFHIYKRWGSSFLFGLTDSYTILRLDCVARRPPGDNRNQMGGMRECCVCVCMCVLVTQKNERNEKRRKIKLMTWIFQQEKKKKIAGPTCV